MIEFGARFANHRGLFDLQYRQVRKQKLEILARQCGQQPVAVRSGFDLMHGAVPPGRSGPVLAGIYMASENCRRSACHLRIGPARLSVRNRS